MDELSPPSRVEIHAPLVARFAGVEVVVGQLVFPAANADPLVEINDEQLALAGRTFRTDAG